MSQQKFKDLLQKSHQEILDQLKVFKDDILDKIQALDQRITAIEATATKTQEQSNLKIIRDELVKLTDMSSQFVDIQKQVNEQEDVLLSVCNHLNELDQKALDSKIEIQGLDVKKNLDIKTTVHEYIQGLGISISPNQLLDAYTVIKRTRLGERKSIFVTFSDEYIKSRVIREKIKLSKGTKTSVYFMNVLTKANSELLIHGKRLRKSNQIEDIKYLGGKFYVIPNGGSKKVLVENTVDIDEIVKENHKHAELTDSPTNSSDTCPNPSVILTPPDSAESSPVTSQPNNARRRRKNKKKSRR